VLSVGSDALNRLCTRVCINEYLLKRADFKISLANAPNSTKVKRGNRPKERKKERGGVWGGIGATLRRSRRFPKAHLKWGLAS